MEKTVIDFSVDGKCSRCCHCCGPVIPLTKTEAEIMILKYKNDDYVKKVVNRNCDITSSPVNLCCPFADLENHRCSIYDDRPKICRVFKCNDYHTEYVKECEQVAHYNHISYYKDKDGGIPKNYTTTFKLLNKGVMHNLHAFFETRNDFFLALRTSSKIKNYRPIIFYFNSIRNSLSLDRYSFKDSIRAINHAFGTNVDFDADYIYEMVFKSKLKKEDLLYKKD